MTAHHRTAKKKIGRLEKVAPSNFPVRNGKVDNVDIVYGNISRLRHYLLGSLVCLIFFLFYFGVQISDLPIRLPIRLANSATELSSSYRICFAGDSLAKESTIIESVKTEHSEAKNYDDQKKFTECSKSSKRV